MQLRQIRHFLAVAEAGSFVKATQRSGVSQPALTASVAKLEAEYQVKLLDRRRARVVPTEAGQRLIERAYIILRACNSLRNQVRSGDKESLRIGVLRTFAAHPICRLVKVFGRVRPDVTVQLIDGRNVDLEARLSEDKIDAFIARIDAPES
jgi:DNA-binding transcriptional LysR family regulator